MDPNVRVWLYTWGAGRVTAEGEHLPFEVAALDVSAAAGLPLLLPATLEHTIDESSPLFQHTHDSLTVCGTLSAAYCGY